MVIINPYEELSPLVLVGGFEGYQDAVYSAVRNKFFQLIEKAKLRPRFLDGIRDFEKRLVEEHMDNDGLEAGLVELVKQQRNLTTANLEYLEKLKALDYYRKAVSLPVKIPPGQYSHWESKMIDWLGQYPYEVNRTAVFHVVLGIESDKVIEAMKRGNVARVT